MRTISVIITAASLTLSQPVWAQMSEGDQRAACTGDAFRLCLFSIPDRLAVRQCLKAKTDQLSSACKLAFNAVERGEKQKAP